ncbi:hypothetical protein [Paenibacillus radicis (ex Xue et al. 2023)]|uniref:Uncharacterized protein n=1 Tax=Paenibacillus radicis (ex Xue et al. 2023) TaxID=2972489 RepID=A0ABT1YFY7_9BACL|nr:hypothetical protein [Paenibacillus radicis (ex Xue et al. 2023)]MCR8630870.1 hypothetical protein [Paenibacillus radicis (ex Xue et al. 2023)]
MLLIEEETKAQIKQSKLRQLSMQHYEMMLQKVIYQARGVEQLAMQAESEISKIEAAYTAVEALE